GCFSDKGKRPSTPWAMAWASSSSVAWEGGAVGAGGWGALSGVLGSAGGASIWAGGATDPSTASMGELGATVTAASARQRAPVITNDTQAKVASVSSGAPNR